MSCHKASARLQTNQSTQTTDTKKKRRPKKWRNLFLAFKFIVSIFLKFQCIFAAYAHNVGDCVTAFVLHVILFSGASQRPANIKMLIVAHFFFPSIHTKKKRLEKPHCLCLKKFYGPQSKLIRNL